MTTVQLHREIPAPPEKVWALLRTFGLEYFPGFKYQLTGEGEGATRTFRMPDGEMTERIVMFNDEGMTLTYGIVRGPWPVKDYRATIRVLPEGAGSRVEWGAEFEPEGADEDAARQIVEGTFKMNLRGLEKFLGG